MVQKLRLRVPEQPAQDTQLRKQRGGAWIQARRTPQPGPWLLNPSGPLTPAGHGEWKPGGAGGAASATNGGRELTVTSGGSIFLCSGVS